MGLGVGLAHTFVGLAGGFQGIPIKSPSSPPAVNLSLQRCPAGLEFCLECTKLITFTFGRHGSRGRRFQAAALSQAERGPRRGLGSG